MVDGLSTLRIPDDKPNPEVQPPPIQKAPPAGRFERIPVLVITLVACNVIAFLLETLGGGSTGAWVLLVQGALYRPLVKQGQLWRLLTAEFLHIGIIHLLFNMYALWALGRLLEPLYGTIRFAVIYFVSAITASIFSVSVHEIISAGASGAIFGVAGAMAVAGWRYHDKIPANFAKALGTGALPTIAYNLIYGFTNAGIDNFAHIGGALGGGLCALLLAPPLERENATASLRTARYTYVARPERTWVRVLAVSGSVACVGSAFLANFIAVVVWRYRMSQVDDLLNQDKVEDARTQLEKISRGWPPHPLIMILRGRISEAQGKTDDAIKDLREAVKLNPDYLDAHLALSEALAAKGDSNAALAEFREAAKLEPNKILAPALLLAGHTNRIWILRFSRNANMLASGSLDGTVRVWDVSSGRQLNNFNFRGNAWPVDFSPDGKLLVTGTSSQEPNSASFKIWDLSTASETNVAKLPSGARPITFSFDWRYMASSKGGGKIEFWDMKGRTPIHVVSSGESPFMDYGKFSEDGRLFCAPGASNTAKVWDVEAGKEIYSAHGDLAAAEEGIVAVFFNRDGTLLTTVDSHKNVMVSDLKTGSALKTTPVDRGGINIVEYVGLSPDGKWLAAESVGGVVLLTDLLQGRTLTLPGHRLGANAVAFSPDGKWLATASWKGQVMLWKVPPSSGE